MNLWFGWWENPGWLVWCLAEWKLCKVFPFPAHSRAVYATFGCWHGWGVLLHLLHTHAAVVAHTIDSCRISLGCLQNEIKCLKYFYDRNKNFNLQLTQKEYKKKTQKYILLFRISLSGLYIVCLLSSFSDQWGINRGKIDEIRSINKKVQTLIWFSIFLLIQSVSLFSKYL